MSAIKTIAYTALHYGTDYLGYAIKSIINYVDEYWVLYVPHGSHGHQTTRPCPDSRADLYTIAQHVAGRKLHWVNGDWQHEGQHRDSILQYAPDADIIIVLDCDEIWPPELIELAVERKSMFSGRHLRAFRTPIIHYWRSFYRAVLYDPAFPVRVIYPKNTNGEGVIGDMRPLSYFPINHMGYAQRPAIVEYKQWTHGHKNEWRRDIDWYRDRFLANAQRDCHPVGSEWWNPEAVNPWDYLPGFMREHPYSLLEVIE